MRELSVYYCPKCGHYGYYQLAKNAVCPACECKMSHLDMRYQDFIKLDPKQRDTLLIREILTHYTPVSNRLIASNEEYNHRKVIASLRHQICELQDKNKELEHRANWMHETIWELLGRCKQLEQLLTESGIPLSESLLNFNYRPSSHQSKNHRVDPPNAPEQP